MSSDCRTIEVPELEKMAEAEKEQRERLSVHKLPNKVPELLRMVEAEKERQERLSIYKLPAYVKNIKKNAYTPQMVSFGPYHHGNENLEDMEFHKKRALNHFLIRSSLNYNDYRQSLMEIVGEVLEAYNCLDSKLYNKENPNAFLEIMIRDGIFMLEVFANAEERATGYADNDPIFSEHGDFYVIPQIKRDMLIIENQIPIKVLQRLYQLQHKKITVTLSLYLSFSL